MSGNHKRLKLFLIIAIIVSVGSTLILLVDFRFASNEKKEYILPAIKNGANLSIKNFHYIANREGKKSWVIDAREARQVGMDKASVFELDGLSATCLVEEGGQFFLTAQKGVLTLDSNNIDVSGNVVVKNESFGMKTEKLHYDHGRNIIQSQDTVTLSGDFFNLTADSITIDLNANQSRLEGNIEGTFSGGFML